MYLNLIQLAESLGVAEKTIETWIEREQLPATLDHGRWLFDRDRVVQWAVTRGLTARSGFLAPSTPALGPENTAATLLDRGGIHRHVDPLHLFDAFGRIVDCVPDLSPPVRGLLATRLRAPGGLSLAPVGMGFALPHPAARVALGHDSGALALLLLDQPYTSGEKPVDNIPITRMFFFVAPSSRIHIDLLAHLSRIIAAGTLATALDEGASDAEIRAFVGGEGCR